MTRNNNTQHPCAVFRMSRIVISLRVAIEGQGWCQPAITVIPAPVAYIKVVAIKKLVVVDRCKDDVVRSL